jgi:3-hydroxyisobutyrate dehydrogenase-like beta-hydroxyacid dehydrogenase
MATLPQVAWIGTGRMGTPMAGFLLAAGYPVTVFSRSPGSRQKLVAQGAQEAASVADCVRGAQFIFSSLPDDSALREVALGSLGVLGNASAGSIFADTSTVSVEVSEQIAAEAARRGIAYLRIPISGNAAQAQKGEVTVLVSGPAEAWDQLKPVCDRFSKASVYLGAGEQARGMKLVVNAMVYIFAQGMAEALALGRKAGLDWNTMLDTLAQSALASPWLKVKAELMKRRDFTPTMTAPLVLKDLDLMLASARAQGVPMPLTAMTRQLMQMLVGAGLGDEDYLAAIKLAEMQSGLPTDRLN